MARTSPVAGKVSVEGKKQGGAVDSSRNPDILPKPEHLACPGSPCVREASGDTVSAAMRDHSLHFTLLWGTVWTERTYCFDDTIMMPRAKAFTSCPFRSSEFEMTNCPVSVSLWFRGWLRTWQRWPGAQRNFSPIGSPLPVDSCCLDLNLPQNNTPPRSHPSEPI